MPQSTLKVELMKCTENPLETIALAARLCYSDAQIADLNDANRGSAEMFVKKLLALGHLSPIEHVSYTFGIEGVSRALLAQITRHRIASFSVQSQRYVKQISKDDDVADFNYVIPKSVEESGKSELFISQMNQIAAWYSDWLSLGIDKEDARFVLPNACETRFLLTMNARELMHFFTLRCCNRAQWEIRALAWIMLGIVKRETSVLFDNKGPSCVAGACSEGKMSCKLSENVRQFASKIDALAKEKAPDHAITEFVRKSM